MAVERIEGKLMGPPLATVSIVAMPYTLVIHGGRAQTRRSGSELC